MLILCHVCRLSFVVYFRDDSENEGNGLRVLQIRIETNLLLYGLNLLRIRNQELTSLGDLQQIIKITSNFHFRELKRCLIIFHSQKHKIKFSRKKSHQKLEFSVLFCSSSLTYCFFEKKKKKETWLIYRKFFAQC